jgi:hypothetical protein
MNIDNIILKSIENPNGNTLIVGPGGSGKSHIITYLNSVRNDILIAAPSGIAAQHIKGHTIQSLFSITPNQYTGEESYSKNRIGQDSIDKVRHCTILLIDEISMLRCEILDIVDYKLRIIRNNQLPFGGMKLVLLGDPCQMEPVIQKYDSIKLDEIYPDNSGDYNFYNARVMRTNDYFSNTFDIFKLTQDYRHKDDILFRDMLSNVRVGKITDKQLDLLNSRYNINIFYDDAIQYLTVSNSKAESINKIFIDKIHNTVYYSQASFEKICENYIGNLENIKVPFKNELPLKETMRVMFVKNDARANGRRWANGTMGKIEKIHKTVDGISVSVRIDDNIYEVAREKCDLNHFSEEQKEFIKVGTMEQFPFIPAYAITIDKSQGLTLDKIGIVMGNRHRDNQIYVAISRTRHLRDVIIFGRRIERRDIRLSPLMKNFLQFIDENAITIEPSHFTSNTINILGNNNGSIIINNISKITA